MNNRDKPKAMLRYLTYTLDFKGFVSYLRISKNPKENTAEQIANKIEKFA